MLRTFVDIIRRRRACERNISKSVWVEDHDGPSAI